jgi:hypothetical protein
MQKTIYLAALLLFSVSLIGQTTYHKRVQGMDFFSMAPTPGGEVLGAGRHYVQFDLRGSLCLFANDGALVWGKYFPTLNFMLHTIHTADGGFLAVGDSVRPTGINQRPRYAVVSKLNNNGTVVWSKLIGNPTREVSSKQLLEVPDGYIVSGIYNSFITPGRSNVFFTKLDKNGNSIWSKTYFGDYSNFDASFSAQLVEGDTLYASGYIQGNAALLRLNVNTGELFGVSSFGGIYVEDINSISPTLDGNFIMAGSTRSTTASEEDRPWVIKINRMGDVIWSKTYGITGANAAANLEESGDSSGYMLSVGLGTQGFSGLFSILAKIDQSGNLLWAYNYANEQSAGITGLKRATDGGFLAVLRNGMLKVDDEGRISNGCCPAPINLEVEEYSPPVQNVPFMTEDWETPSPFTMQAPVDISLVVSDFCQIPLTSIVEQIPVCQGDSIQINGVFYQAPFTVLDTVQSLNGGCDTLRVYNLVPIPEPFKVQTVSFCPGTSVIVNGVTYTEPGTVFDILPSTIGCDTLSVTFLEWKQLPRKFQTTTFCPGDTVYFNGVGYQFPGILPIPDTLPSQGTGCDTLLFHVLSYPSGSSAVSANCPSNQVLITAPATPVLVQYDLPTGFSNCTCPEVSFSLNQGLPSGSLFPVGSTQVCYSVSDICGASQTCCFEVKVEEEAACDVKSNGCVQYELLGISTGAGQDKTYQMRVTNHCASPLTYTAFQVPNSVQALAPAQNSTYVSANARPYTVRNPNHAPFHSVRFASVGGGIVNGQSDVFEYTLPAQSSPLFIKATTRLASGALYEVMLNTFGCEISSGNIVEERTAEPALNGTLQVFPNPTSGTLFIDLSAQKGEKVQLALRNTQAQELSRQSILAGDDAMPFQLPKNLPDGIYLLEITLENGEKHLARFVMRQ